jgi:DNA-binding NarL/FixJ family response regulator
VKILLVSADPRVREQMGVAVGGLERSTREPMEFLEASDGVHGIKAAWRYLPDVVVADEIMSRAGAFALTKELKEATTPFPGVVVVLLDRPQDGWLAKWSGADAWFVKPVNPFELADTVAALVGGGQREVV